MGKVISFEQLGSIRPDHPGRKIVHCHGVFDLFHIGHLAHLKSAKSFGDLLVVTVTPDTFVNKGPGRPRYGEQQRAAMLAALEIVDYVAINRFPKAIETIKKLKPDFYVKGPDYRNKQMDITGGILEEEDAVTELGGKIVFTDDATESSTQLLNEYFSPWDENQQAAIERVRRAAPLPDLLKSIDDLAGLKVLVVGEPIVDTYIFCQPEALSTKSPTVSARYLNKEDYAGGSLAIAKHLEALGCDVRLLITHGNEPYFKELLASSVSPRIKLEESITAGIPTPRKTRYLVPFRAQRIFELIELRHDQWMHVSPDPFIKKFRQMAADVDVVIVADFGHGMFEGDALAALSDIKSFIALNVQTNSGNYGFNPFTKHKHFNYLSIDERECRLAMHDRFSAPVDLARRAVRERIRQKTSVTLGTAGSLYFDSEGNEHSCPTFFKDVVDTTGAGDAYFALTAMLSKLGTPAPAIPFLGNCYAGLKTRIIGNKSAVAKVDLIRTVQSIMR